MMYLNLFIHIFFYNQNLFYLLNEELAMKCLQVHSNGALHKKYKW